MTDRKKQRIGEDTKAFIAALILMFCLGLGISVRYEVEPLAGVDRPISGSHEQARSGNKQGSSQPGTIGNANQNTHNAKDNATQSGANQTDLDWPTRVQLGSAIVQTGSAVATFLATLALVWVGYSQIRVYRQQRDLMSGQLNAALTAADAAKQSADMLLSLERPWLVGVINREHITSDLERIILDGSGSLDDIPIRFVNEGRTSAFPVEFYTDVVNSADDIFPCRNLWIFTDKKPVISPGDAEVYDLAGVTNLQASDAEGILYDQTTVWFSGCLNYTDFFGKNHTTVFCYRYTSALGFEAWGGKTYNYMT